MFMLVLFGGFALVFGISVLIRKFSNVDGWRDICKTEGCPE